MPSLSIFCIVSPYDKGISILIIWAFSCCKKGLLTITRMVCYLKNNEAEFVELLERKTTKGMEIEAKQAEQKELRKDIEKLQAISDKEKQRKFSKNQFLKSVRQFMEMKTLTPIILNELVEKIEVYYIQGVDKARTQEISINYNFVGVLDLPEITEVQSNVVLDNRQGVAIEYVVKKQDNIMGKTIAISTQKGGCGKQTPLPILASGLHDKGKRCCALTQTINIP